MATEIKRRLIGRRNRIHIRLNSYKLRGMYIGQRSDNCSYVLACLTGHLSYSLESRRSINPPTDPLPVRHCIVSQFKPKLFLSASNVRPSVHISVYPSLCPSLPSLSVLSRVLSRAHRQCNSVWLKLTFFHGAVDTNKGVLIVWSWVTVLRPATRPTATCQFNYNWQVAATVLIYNKQTARFH